jgi:hypothetical protein
MKKEELSQLIERGLSSYQIAETLNCSQTTITYWLRKLGLKTKKHKSLVWTIDIDALREFTKSSNSFSEILRKIGYVVDRGSGIFHILKRRLIHDGIDFSHIQLGRGSNRGKRCNNQINHKYTLEKVCVENSSYNRTHLKRRLLKEGILKNHCSICGMGEIWQEKPIVHVLDHINGIPDDNRIENLRMVCPCCNSQLPTFSGRNAYKS